MPDQYGTQQVPLDIFYGLGGTTGNKTKNTDLPQWLRDLGMKGDAYAGGMLKPELRYGFKYKNGKIHFADGTSYDAKKVKEKGGKVSYSYTGADGQATRYDPTDEQNEYNKKYQNATANQSFVDKLGATADRTRAHVHDVLEGASDALRGKGSIFGGTPLGTKLSNAVTGRDDKPIADQYGGPTKESNARYAAEHGAGALGYQPELHAVGSAIGSAYAGAALGGLAGNAVQGLGGSANLAGIVGTGVEQLAPTLIGALGGSGGGAGAPPMGGSGGNPFGPLGANGAGNGVVNPMSLGPFPDSGFRDQGAKDYLNQVLGMGGAPGAPAMAAPTGYQLPPSLDSFAGMDFSSMFGPLVGGGQFGLPMPGDGTKSIQPVGMSSPKMSPGAYGALTGPAGMEGFTAQNSGTRGPDTLASKISNALAGTFGNGGGAYTTGFSPNGLKQKFSKLGVA